MVLFGMLALQMPVWAHVILLVACFGLLAYVAKGGWRREDQLRKKLGAARTRAAAEEIKAETWRKKCLAQSVELARYRGQIPMELRVTQVLLSDKGEPEPEG